jgi:hypothetical protein
MILIRDKKDNLMMVLKRKILAKTLLFKLIVGIKTRKWPLKALEIKFIKTILSIKLYKL